jgi:hypothetical protein
MHTRVMLICWSFIIITILTRIAQSDEHRGPRLVLQFELYPPDRPQRRAALNLVILSGQVQQYRDAHRLGQSRDQHRERCVEYKVPR